MELNDGSSYRVVTDPTAYMAQRQAFGFRAVSARDGVMYVDTAFTHHRTALAPLPALLMYQYVWQNAGTPEQQAGFFCDTIGTLRPNEMVMLDIEAGGGITDPADFARRWLGVVEPRLGCWAWLYVPRALNAALAPWIDGRVVIAPKYSGTAQRGTAPDWPHDVHQYTDRGPFPGCPDPAGGDLSYTPLTAAQLLARTRPEGGRMLSQNGWEAGPTVSLTAITVPGTKTKMPVKSGDVATVLQWIATRWHNEIEPLVEPGNWGYAYRPISGSTSLSNHASGTAIDLNAPAHPLGTLPLATLSKAQVATAKRIEADTNGVVRWGGSYTGRADAMHWEINAGPAEVAALARRISGGGTTPAPAPTPGGFLMALTDAEQREILERLRGDTAGRGFDMLQSIESLTRDVQYRVRGTHPAMDALQVIQYQIDALKAAVDALAAKP